MINETDTGRSLGLHDQPADLSLLGDLNVETWTMPEE